jgi:hypothetical protein
LIYNFNNSEAIGVGGRRRSKFLRDVKDYRVQAACRFPTLTALCKFREDFHRDSQLNCKDAK